VNLPIPGKSCSPASGLPVLPGQVAASAEEARDIATSIGGTVVIKAQVLVGGAARRGA